MMGGFGSGRPSGFGRDTVEACRSLDVNRLYREGCLGSGWRGGWEWKRDGEQVASITLRAEEDRLVLSYNYRWNGGEWESIEELVHIVRVPCPFGGTRPYFICPGVVNGVGCGRRVIKLYGPGRYFLCRHCYLLAYQSQREQPHERALRRATNIRMQLGGDPGMLSPCPEKPAGMHWRTFERLSREVHRAEAMAEEHLAMQSGRLKARVGRRNRAKRFWT